MRAAFYERNGTARDVLHVGAVETPHAGAGEVDPCCRSRRKPRSTRRTRQLAAWLTRQRPESVSPPVALRFPAVTHPDRMLPGSGRTTHDLPI